MTELSTFPVNNILNLIFNNNTIQLKSKYNYIINKNYYTRTVVIVFY